MIPQKLKVDKVLAFPHSINVSSYERIDYLIMRLKIHIIFLLSKTIFNILLKLCIVEMAKCIY